MAEKVDALDLRAPVKVCKLDPVAAPVDAALLAALDMGISTKSEI